MLYAICFLRPLIDQLKTYLRLLFVRIFYQGFRHTPRGSTARRVDVVKPSRVKKGYFFKTCHVYRSAAGIQYDYKLYNKFGKEVKLQARGWRKTLSFNFSLKGKFTGNANMLLVQ